MLFLWVTWFSVHFVGGTILNCNKLVQSQICKNGSELEDFLSAPHPYPAKVNITANIIDIISLDEEAQTVTMQMKLIFEWVDTRLGVNKSPYDLEK